MNQTKTFDTKVLGFSTVAAILGATFAMAMSAGAATPEQTVIGSWRGGCHDEGQSGALQAAIEAGDYRTWKILMIASSTKPRYVNLLSVITEDNFATFTALHAAIESGDTTKAAALRAELGLPERSHMSGRIRGIGTHRADK